MASGKCFTDLPDEMLLEIFSNLDIEDLAMSVQHVNLHWKDVSQDESLWKNQTFSPRYKMSDEEIAKHLMNMPALRAFIFSRGTKTKVIIDTMCKYCRDIRHIEFKWSHRLSNSRLQDILKNHPHIENLNIPVPKESDQLDFAGMIGQFQNLTTLSFTDQYVHTVANGVLKAIAEGCPSLLHLDLGNTTFQDQDVRYLLERKGQLLLSFSVRCYISTLAHRLLTECSNLEYLFYENYNEDLPSTYIQFLSKLSKLHNLTISYFKQGQTNIQNIFKKQSLSRLIKLNICFCDGFDDAALTGILTNCPQLQFLIFRGNDLSDAGFKHIGTCNNLEHLDIASCASLTDKSMEYVGAGCPNLKHLDIGNCSGFTNKSIEYVCTGCQKLKYLDIQQCPEMTDEVLENIFRSKELQVLNLMWNLNLLGINFHMIPSHLVCLTELHVEGCFSIDDKCLDKLQEEMPHLKIIGSHADNEEPDVDLADATFFISQLL
ncbi:F-box/LRR-repeat protein 2-like [Zootermopsis nevadensis]|uniref:F-box/LRR-repeat protein 2 n=1 Tax=Zootermopsis nevadensis TaxID=136037 RepID=A0A067RAY0_ZOONE|nr:F-box/LRR-repeat protein 2-like [Zootermopsis nevadensis]XP_021918962.1 F-box/LRR-repeat protein 2-like [Zootermopsis nevadensis]KDR19903.1 F-box/LRR-repeat protein 2 [Zootermopsis nevadensis]